MQELKVSTGLIAYRVNDACEVAINPTDAYFIEGVYRVFEALEKKQESYQKQIDSEGHKAVFQIARTADREIREEINALFGFDICSAVFGSQNVCALSDGMPVWANLLLAFVDLVSDHADAERAKQRARIEKYTSKYHK